MNKEIAALRQDYAKGTLEIKDVLANPIEQFSKWIKEAIHSEIAEPNAMILATANQNGQPSARVLLLKGIEEQGFIFYTNYSSAKAQQMAENPKAAMVFNWLELQRQVRIEGTVEKLDEEKSLAYFQSRPKGSQIGAWVSPQSSVIPDRTVLEKEVEILSKKYESFEKLPKPPHWGGYILKPTLIEFWQGRQSRLHDRILYTLTANNEWSTVRLAP